MDSLLISYGITDTDAFKTFLSAHDAIIAGSSVLSLVTKDFVPNDIDIWVPHTYTQTEYPTRSLFDEFLKKYGFVFSLTTPHQANYGDGALNAIRYIQSYVNKDNKQIQVIYTTVSPCEAVNTFDYNITQIYYDPKTDTIESVYMDDIKNKKMYYVLDKPMTNHEVERKAKYESRGFKYVDTVNSKN